MQSQEKVLGLLLAVDNRIGTHVNLALIGKKLTILTFVVLPLQVAFTVFLSLCVFVYVVWYTGRDSCDDDCRAS